jgi:hypothetical protein
MPLGSNVPLGFCQQKDLHIPNLKHEKRLKLWSELRHIYIPASPKFRCEQIVWEWKHLQWTENHLHSQQCRNGQCLVCQIDPASVELLQQHLPG